VYRGVLARAVSITTIRRLRTWRHPSTRVRRPRSRGRAPTSIAAIGHLWTRRDTPGGAIRKARAGRATPGELRHRDRLARADLVERVGNGPVVRVVEGRVWIVTERLVRVVRWQRGDCVRVVEVGRRVGCCGRCIADRTSACVRSGIKPRPARAVCWQGNGSIVSVELWPFNLLACS